MRVVLTGQGGGKQWNVVGKSATCGVISALAVLESAPHEGALGKATGKRERCSNLKTDLA